MRELPEAKMMVVDGLDVDTDVVHLFTTLLIAVLGWYIKMLNGEISSLKQHDQSLISELSDLKVLIAGDYVRRSELKELIDAVFRKLDRIEGKLDDKQDKH